MGDCQENLPDNIKDCRKIIEEEKNTEKIWPGERIKDVPMDIQKVGRRKLRMMNNSQNLSDLRMALSNRLEKFKGREKDYYSIRIND